MLTVLRRGAKGFAPVADPAAWSLPDDAIWIDLLQPTRDEELAVERAFDLDLPTPEEMRAIEPSSRLYQEDGATFMTATLLARSQDDNPTARPATFVLARGVLVTLRYSDFRAFSVFEERTAGAGIDAPPNGTVALLGLLEAIVERVAEILEAVSTRVETASAAIFEGAKDKGFNPLLSELARSQSLTALARAALVSLGRLVSFAFLAHEVGGDEACRARLGAIQHDIQSLTDQAASLGAHLAFLLDAALGLINIEQNAIIKIFSIVAVVFLPPTLVASIYGMNFHHMPELAWRGGYPLALVLMLVSAVAPLWFFKRKGWL